MWQVIQDSGRYPGLRELEMDDMRHRLPLQAADLVAYELLKFDPADPGAARMPFRTLIDIDPRAFVVNIDAEYLRQQAEGLRNMPQE